MNEINFILPPFPLEWLPQPIYLVGGIVRDTLLSRRGDYLDWDFVVPSEAVFLARTIANRTNSGFVVLDAERQIARVVLEQGTVDFAQQDGATIDTDLDRRDFTINAIAYNPFTQKIIDPHHGRQDLQQKLIRMISPKNLQDDPLRLLRAYRQAAQLNFDIEPKTRATIRQFSPLLSQVATERIQTELMALLRTSQGVPWITAAWKDKLLSQVLYSELTEANLALLAAVDNAAATVGEIYPQLTVEIASEIQGLAATSKRTWLMLAKLTSLLLFQTSYSQANWREITVEGLLKRLKYSRVEIQGIDKIIKFLPKIQTNLSIREQYFLFKELGVIFPTLVMLAVANEVKIETISPLINRYLNSNDPVAHPKPLVTGKDLMEVLNLSPGQKIGQLLTEIQIACAEGKISTKEEALEFANSILVELPIPTAFN